MKGKASTIPVGEVPARNFRIADSDVKEARPSVHGKFSNNEVVDAQATSTATVAARTPDTPLSEVYADPNAAQETAAIAAPDAVVEAPQVHSAANGAAAAIGVAADRPSDEEPELELEGDAAHIAHMLPRFEPKLKTLKGNMANAIHDFVKQIEKPWHKMDQYDQDRTVRQIGDLATLFVTGCVNVVAARGFEHYEVKVGTFTGDREKDLVQVKVVGRLDTDFLDALTQDTTCMIVFRNSESFYSDAKRKPETDKIGSLGIPVPEKKAEVIVVPTSGPGTPTPPEVMDAVGKGPEAAVVAAAAGAAEPAPAPTTVA